MATNIPLPGLMGDSFLKGMDSGSGMFQKIMQPILEREKQKQQDAQFRSTEARMGSEFDRQFAQTGGMNNLRRMLIEEQIKHQQNLNDPNYKRDQMMNSFSALQSMQNQGQPAPEQPSALSMMMGGQPSMGQGQGMMSDESPFLSAIQQDASQEPTQPQQPQPGLSDDDLNEMKRQLMYQSMGVKAPSLLRGTVARETPEQRQEREIATSGAKLQQDADFKAQEIKQKDIKYYNDAIPQLNKSLKALQEAKKITENNPDIFGHSDEERFLRVTPNLQAGYLVRSVLPTIIDTQSKLSRQGSQLALKTSKGKVPSVTDSQQVALGKIMAGIKETELDMAKAISLSGKSGTTPAYSSDGRLHNIPNDKIYRYLDENEGAKLYAR